MFYHVIVLSLFFLFFSLNVGAEIHNFSNAYNTPQQAEYKDIVAMETDDLTADGEVVKSDAEASQEEKSRLQKRREQLVIERAEETSRFKKKAIENTERREKKHEEIMQRKLEKESRFQRQAREKEEQERKEQKLKEENKVKSRFMIEAEKKAEERVKKREEKEKRLKRNQNK